MLDNDIIGSIDDGYRFIMEHRAQDEKLEDNIEFLILKENGEIVLADTLNTVKSYFDENKVGSETLQEMVYNLDTEDFCTPEELLYQNKKNKVQSELSHVLHQRCKLHGELLAWISAQIAEDNLKLTVIDNGTNIKETKFKLFSLNSNEREGICVDAQLSTLNFRFILDFKLSFDSKAMKYVATFPSISDEYSAILRRNPDEFIKTIDLLINEHTIAVTKERNEALILLMSKLK